MESGLTSLSLTSLSRRNSPMLRSVLAALAGLSVTIPIGAAAQAAGPTDPVSHVNPFIGTTNLGNTYPGAVRPFGMLAWSPQTSRGNQISTPAPGGYQYAATRIRGLS